MLTWTKTWPTSQWADDLTGRVEGGDVVARIYRMGGGGRHVGWAWSIVVGGQRLGSGCEFSAEDAASKVLSTLRAVIPGRVGSETRPRVVRPDPGVRGVQSPSKGAR